MSDDEIKLRCVEIAAHLNIPADRVIEVAENIYIFVTDRQSQKAT
jgi:hypothetical protein